MYGSQYQLQNIGESGFKEQLSGKSEFLLKIICLGLFY